MCSTRAALVFDGFGLWFWRTCAAGRTPRRSRDWTLFACKLCIVFLQSLHCKVWIVWNFGFKLWIQKFGCSSIPKLNSGCRSNSDSQCSRVLDAELANWFSWTEYDQIRKFSSVFSLGNEKESREILKSELLWVGRGICRGVCRGSKTIHFPGFLRLSLSPYATAVPSLRGSSRERLSLGDVPRQIWKSRAAQVASLERVLRLDDAWEKRRKLLGKFHFHMASNLSRLCEINLLISLSIHITNSPDSSPIYPNYLVNLSLTILPYNFGRLAASNK